MGVAQRVGLPWQRRSTERPETERRQRRLPRQRPLPGRALRPLLPSPPSPVTGGHVCGKGSCSFLSEDAGCGYWAVKCRRGGRIAQVPAGRTRRLDAWGAGEGRSSRAAPAEAGRPVAHERGGCGVPVLGGWSPRGMKADALGPAPVAPCPLMVCLSAKWTVTCRRERDRKGGWEPP